MGSSVIAESQRSADQAQNVAAGRFIMFDCGHCKCSCNCHGG